MATNAIDVDGLLGVIDQYPEFQQFKPGSDVLAHQSWFTVLVLMVWTVVAPAVGYLKFRTMEIV
ncbi:hypothetical protein C499_13355 [Halogeometricum borinquense DSM 11551]|uniref:Uncharacterized protein n=2 Tax=Halogeometricum borinquense TaxID=60847 RepID=E4NUL7_HALBP|nr:hypothetical protein [Halogeometricum borinquense]ADQ68737.1 hypothetical protein Hbor_32020 [Halogeometricum borinquense DSM 11551]ELY25476.1 hypothetical protein C499_13355 [Halogeometricum borinquense DSM 11551]RYJ08682.1 hypothetical protein ELS19_19585 [Halogeometricum borinquense]